MAKVTSKLQVTIPRKLARALGIEPGDEIEWVEAGDSLRIVPSRSKAQETSPEARAELFARATERIAESQADLSIPERPPKDRGWSREDLYVRGRSR